MEVSASEKSVRIGRPHTCNQHISGAVIIGGITLLRAVAPLPEVPVEAVGKRYMIVFEEVGRAPAPAGSQGGFGNHRIPFEQRRTGVDGRCRTHCKIPDQIFQGPEHPTCPGELHLCHVPAFVHRQLRDPGGGFGVVGFRIGIEFHTPRGPGDHSVGLCGVCVQDDRHLPAVHLVRIKPATEFLGGGKALQALCVLACQRVGSLGINDAEVLAFKAFPLDGRGVHATGHHLRVQRQSSSKNTD